LPIEERRLFDMEGKVQQTIYSFIEHLLVNELNEDVRKQSKEGENEYDDGEEDNGADLKDKEDEEKEQGEEGKAEEEVHVQKCRDDSSEYLPLQGCAVAKFVRHKEESY
jgi:hypothetical protein